MATNLDAMINRIGFEMVSKGIVNENEINKMLGVLSNDGVYAWWVYINDKLKTNSMKLLSVIFNQENFSKVMSNYKIDTLKTITEEKIDNVNNSEKDKEKKQIFQEWQKEVSQNFFHKLSENLSDLLFFREILEKILIYARYHAKAMGEMNE